MHLAKLAVHAIGFTKPGDELVERVGRMDMGDILDRIEDAAIHHVRAPVVEARHDLEHVPELARREHALRGEEIGVEAPVLIALDGHALTLCQGEELRRLGLGRCERLINQYVLTSKKRLSCQFGMGMRRRANLDHINLGIAEHIGDVGRIDNVGHRRPGIVGNTVVRAFQGTGNFNHPCPVSQTSERFWHALSPCR